MKAVSHLYTPRYPDLHELLEARRFVVLAAHRRFGKTTLAVNHLLRAAVLCREPLGFFAYVAPLRNQAKAVAWNFLKKYSAPLPGRTVSESELAVRVPSAGGGATVRLFGADRPDALRGLYFDAVVLDEVAQMRPEVWGEILQPALADRRGRALFIGTPKGVNLFSELFDRAVREQAAGNPDWAALRFRADETQALPPEELERLRRELSPNAFRQEMLCDFSAASDDALIAPRLVNEAAARTPDPTLYAGLPVILGVDVARFGGDASVIFRRQGPAAFAPVILHGLDNMAVADRTALEIASARPAAVFIDVGQGQGVIDRLRRLGHEVEEVPFGGRALRDDRFVNRRAEMWYAVREWLLAGACIPDDARLRKELAAPVYHYDASGRIALEPKAGIKRRLGFSPDLGDALALTFAAPAACTPDAAAPLWADAAPADAVERELARITRARSGSAGFGAFSGLGTCGRFGPDRLKYAWKAEASW